MQNDIAAVALTGTIGAGKTTLAEAISEELHERSQRHALIDLDWLGQVYPAPEGHDPFGYELALQNLEAIWPSFLATGIHRAVIAGTLLNQDQRDRLHAAIGGVAMAVALVKTPQAALEDRIRRRNSGPLRDDFLARTAHVAREIDAANIHDFTVPNHGRAPREVAREVLRTLNWIPPK